MARFLLGVGTAVRLVSAPFARRIADVFGTFRLELALFSISAAVASLFYLPAHAFRMLALVTLVQAAVRNSAVAPVSRERGLAATYASTRLSAPPKKAVVELLDCLHQGSEYAFRKSRRGPGARFWHVLRDHVRAKVEIKDVPITENRLLF